MRSRRFAGYLLFSAFFAAFPLWADASCEAEWQAFLSARDGQIRTEHAYSALQHRLQNELSALSRIGAAYVRREARLQYLRAKAIAEAAAASAACGFFDPSACRRLSALSRKIAALQTRLMLLPGQRDAALDRRRLKISRLNSDLEEALQELLQANLLYIRTFAALNICRN